MKHTTQHTPGPWELWNHAETDQIAVGPKIGGVAVADVCIANGQGIVTHSTIDRGQANARLIAAAPELLAALEILLPIVESLVLDGEKEHFQAQEEARAAIAKAKGNL